MHKGLLGWYGLLRTLFENINWLFFAFTAILLGACIIISNFYDAGPVNKVVHAFDFDQPIVYYHGFFTTEIMPPGTGIYIYLALCCICNVCFMGANQKV